MNKEIQSNRRKAAKLGRSIITDTISFDEFLDRMPGSEDDLISDLVDQITHEPKKGGFLGAREDEWNRYREQIIKTIEKLEE
jgi:hypothetical protein